MQLTFFPLGSYHIIYYCYIKVIGDSRVATPTHLFKVILAEKKDEVSSLGVFIIPNKAIGQVDLTEFQVRLDELESYTGNVFHPELDRMKVGQTYN